MSDLTSISSIVGSIKAATEIAKLLKDTDLSLQKAETKQRVADLVSALADARMEVAEIQQLLLAKEQEIQRLKEEIALDAKVEWESPYYWVTDNGEKNGPFCQNCWDSEKALIRLQGNGSGFWECKKCGNHYKDKDYKSPSVMSGRSNGRWAYF